MSLAASHAFKIEVFAVIRCRHAHRVLFRQSLRVLSSAGSPGVDRSEWNVGVNRSTSLLGFVESDVHYGPDSPSGGLRVAYRNFTVESLPATISSLMQYVKTSGDIKKAFFFAIYISHEPKACESPLTVSFILDLIAFVKLKELITNPTISVPLASGATAICRYNDNLSDTNRLALQEYSRLAVDTVLHDEIHWQDYAADISWILEVCRASHNLGSEFVGPRIDRIVSLLLAGCLHSVSGLLVSCMLYIHPLLTQEHRELLAIPLEKIQVLSVQAHHVTTLLNFHFQRQHDRRIPSNAPQYLTYLLVNHSVLDISVFTELWECCVRWQLVTFKTHHAIPWIIEQAVKKHFPGAPVASLVALIFPLIELTHFDKVSSKIWSALALKLAPQVVALCQELETKGLQPSVTLASKTLFVLTFFRACPDELFIALVDAAMGNARLMTPFDLTKILEAVRWQMAARGKSSIREALVSIHNGVQSMPCDGAWMSEVRDMHVNDIARACENLQLLQCDCLVPVDMISTWLITKCSLGGGRTYTIPCWFAVAISCVEMGQPPEEFAQTALLALDAGLTMPPRQALYCAYLSGPIANVMPRRALSLTLGVATSDLSWCRQSAPHLERILVTYCWTSLGSDAIDNDVITFVAENFFQLRTAATNRINFAGNITRQLQSELSADCVGTEELARVDYLASSIVLLYSVSTGRFLPVANHLPTWRDLSIEHRRAGDVRMVCVLPMMSNLFLTDEMLRQSTSFGTGEIQFSSWPGVRLRTYCKALVTLGAYNVMPLHPAGFRDFRGSLAALAQNSALSRTRFTPFCPPWSKSRGTHP